MKTYVMLIINILLLITVFYSCTKTCCNKSVDPLIKDIKVYDVSQFRVIEKSESLDDRKKVISYNLENKLNSFNRHWDKKTKDLAVKTLLAGEIQFNIDHRLVLSIIAVESEFKITAKRKNRNKTIDYSLTQQNSKSIKYRYKHCEPILMTHKIIYTNSYYDIPKNIMSCYVYLNDIRSTTEYDAKMIIMAYNLGIRGATLKDRQVRGENYFNLVMQEYSRI